MWSLSAEPDGEFLMIEDQGAKYLVFYSSRSLKMRKKYISYAQYLCISFEGNVFNFQFLNGKIHNHVGFFLT